MASAITTTDHNEIRAWVERNNGHPARVSDYFGVNTFGVRQMRDKLPRDVYEKILAAVRQGRIVAAAP